MSHAQTTSFDADGRTTSVLDNLGHGPTYAYGHGGELLTTTDALSHTTADQYDSRFRLVQATDPNGGITQVQLDPAGNKVAVIDPDNNKTSFVFDPLNRETSETDARNFTRSFAYDASSDMTSETDKDGRVIDLAYDNLHRQTSENWMSGGTVAYAIATAYDAGNEITSQSDPDSSYAFTLDNLGRTLTVDNAGTPSVPHVLLTSGYDAGNDRTSLSATINGTADFLNNYTFDADQRLTDETQTGQNGGNGVDPKQIEVGYNALGQFTSVARYNFVGVGPMVDVATGAFSYDTGNRLTGLDYTYGGGHAIDAYSWTLDNADRVTSVNSTIDGTASYGYDPTDQLTSASYTGTNAPPNATYSFSKNGNRTMAGYTTGTDNEITSDGTFNYAYDGEGNRTLRTRISNASANDYQTKFFYDYRNRLTDEEYFNNSGTLTKHIHYVYDTLDREIGKQVDDTGSGSYDRSEWYAYDGSQPVEQFDGNGNQTMRDFNGPSPAGVDALMAQEPIVTQGKAGSSDWDLADNLGTLRYMVSDASAVVDHVITDAFGQTTSESNTTVSHWEGFTGGHADTDTGDVTNLERRYDPSTGGWTTKDPIGFSAGDSNTARYSGNSPTNAIDPTGLCPDYPTPTPSQPGCVTGHHPMPQGGAAGPNPGSAANGSWPGAAGPYPGSAPNGSWPVGLYGPYSGLSPQQMAYAAQVGCFGLMQMQLNMCPPNPTPNMGGAYPITAPGMNWFGSYAAAQQYQSQQAPNGPATIVAYQFDVTAGGWTPPTGVITPQQIIAAGGGGYASGNWATLMSNASHQWYWQHMNQGNPGATVFHDPLNLSAANMGLPSGLGAMNTTIYAVYVPPPMPMPQPAPPPEPSVPLYGYYFQQMWQHLNPFNYFN